MGKHENVKKKQVLSAEFVEKQSRNFPNGQMLPNRKGHKPVKL